MRKACVLAPLLVAAWLAPAIARAQTCSFTNGPTALSFAYDPAAAAATDSSASFTFDCQGGNPKVMVALSSGAGTFNPRQMVLGADRLNYNLYIDAARTQIWGDGTAYPMDGIDRKKTPYVVYGRVFAGQWVTPGTYSDTIVVTLNY
jgi:spore coat protein U-like protein